MIVNMPFSLYRIYYLRLPYCVLICHSLTNLESLELRDNLLSQFPSSLNQLVNLQFLDAGSNMIEDVVSCVIFCYVTGFFHLCYFAALLIMFTVILEKNFCRTYKEMMVY